MLNLIMNRTALVFFCVLLISSCNDDTKSPSKDLPAAYQPKKGLEVEPELQKTDSLQLLYFNDPDGDSVRYTRFYSHTISKDSTTINTLLKGLNQPFEQLNEVKKCRSEGKIYLFAEQEPLKTIYFSTRCDSCCYLYFIKDGAFLYFQLSRDLSTILKNEKAKAQKP